MDEQTRALYQQLLGELYRRMEQDPEIRRALRRIEEGKATFRDTAVWSDRSAELLGEVFSEAIADMPAEARESICKALLRERYDSTNDICGEVQEALDAAQGLSLKPVRAKFPAERVQQIAHSLLDPTVAAEVIGRRARAPVATAARSFHDDCMRENARVRTSLGFKCYLNRVAATGCCKWCTDVAGRYVYGDHPDDIFGRHDNCSCTVTFEHGRERQDVWSKRSWTMDPAEVESNGFEPVVNSQERAREIEENAVYWLTNQEIYGTIKAGEIQEKFRQYVPSREERIDIIKRGIAAEKPIFDNGSLAYYYQFVEKDNGYYDVVMHGTSEFASFFGTPIDYQTLGAIIMGRSDYKRGTPIRLFSCSTGKGDDSFAENLSRMLSTEVKAPDQDIHISLPLNGKSQYHIQSKKFAHDGAWAIFDNGKLIS